MKESYHESLAHYMSPESCLDDPRGRGEALTGENMPKRSRVEYPRAVYLGAFNPWFDAELLETAAKQLEAMILR